MELEAPAMILRLEDQEGPTQNPVEGILHLSDEGLLVVDTQANWMWSVNIS